MSEKVFKHFPENSKCPMCNTSEDGECVLLPIDGTEDGNICQAKPVHVKCIAAFNNFRINEEQGIIYGFYGN